MRRNGREIAASALALSAVGYAVWPWRGDGVWKWFLHLPGSLQGDFEVLMVATLATAAIGFSIAAVGGVRLSSLAVGGVLAYAFWMGVLTMGFELHDPVPYFLYGQVLVGVLLGAAAERALGRLPNRGSRTRSQ